MLLSLKYIKCSDDDVQTVGDEWETTIMEYLKLDSRNEPNQINRCTEIRRNKNNDYIYSVIVKNLNLRNSNYSFRECVI